MQQKTVEVQASLYGMEAVYKACYSFLDRVYIRLEGDPQGKVLVRMRPKADAPPVSLEAVSGEFENEILHQALRVKVASANQKIREYIVTRALASAEGVAAPQQAEKANPEPVLDEELEKEIEKLLAEVEKEGGDDPLKIAVPWKDKHAVSSPPHSDTLPETAQAGTAPADGKVASPSVAGEKTTP